MQPEKEMRMNELQADLVQAIQKYVPTSPLNRLRDIDGSPMFDEPLVGFADGNDPLFDVYKSVVAPEHLTPREALGTLAAGGSEPQVFERVGIVSWVLPIVAETRLGNQQMGEGPCLRWNHTRFQGEEFNDSLRRYVVGWLEERGYVAVAPVITQGFKTMHGLRGHASTWSERHMAYAAGLGTFGLSDGLITARGIAHRCGSVVVNAGWPASPRPFRDHREYCPYVHDESCGVCIERCPCGAIGPDGHDKDRCSEYIHVTLVEWTKRPGYIGEYVACGLCQTGVPCESGIPPR
jgi:epoxyqueuosine reductase